MRSIVQISMLCVLLAHASESFSQPRQGGSLPLQGRTITLDPGHGGAQFGAVGVAGTKEKDINLAVARQLKQLLETAGAKVWMTLETDEDLSLEARVHRHQAWGNDLFVSIHHNANAEIDRSVNRSEVYYQYAEREGPSRDLAYSVARHLEQNLGFPGSQAKVTYAYYVLRRNSYPAILGEASYLSHPGAEQLYQDPSTIRAEAEGYFEAIRDFFDKGFPEIQWLGVLQEAGHRDAIGPFDECPVFIASVRDTRSGMCPDGIEVGIDGKPAAISYRPEDGSLTFTASSHLSSGTHTIRIVARNNAGRHGHALEKSFSIRTAAATILFSGSPVPPQGGILRLTIRVLDKNGMPLADGESVDLLVEGGEIVGRESALKDGRLLVFIRTRVPEIKITASCGSISRSESWLTLSQGEQYGGWVIDEKTGKPIANARLRLAGNPLLQSDRMGWFCFERLQADTDLDVEAEGYWPKRLNTGTVNRPVTEFVIKMRPLFGGVLQGKSIILDPEFGGMETGQIGEGGLRACDVNLTAARLTRSLLQATGSKVELTREDDRTLSDVDRVDFSLARDFDWFITLRHAEPRPGENEPPDLNVSRAYAKWDDARQMASVFPKYMQELMGTDGADTKNCSTWEVMHASNRFQAIGLSPLFMTAPGAARRLEHQSALRKEAQAVLFGLIEYFTFQNDNGLLPPPQPGEISYAERLTQQTGTITGIVTDASSGEPLGDILIGLEDTLWTGTESDGRFFWRYLDPGRYRLTFSHPGYSTMEATVSLQAGEKRETKVTLKPIPGR